MGDIASTFNDLGATAFIVVYLIMENRRLHTKLDELQVLFIDLFKETIELRESDDRRRR